VKIAIDYDCMNEYADKNIKDRTGQAETNDKTVQTTGYQRAMVKTMTKSGSIPQFCYCDEVRMDAIIRQALHTDHILMYFIYIGYVKR